MPFLQSVNLQYWKFSNIFNKLCENVQIYTNNTCIVWRMNWIYQKVHLISFILSHFYHLSSQAEQQSFLRGPPWTFASTLLGYNNHSKMPLRHQALWVYISFVWSTSRNYMLFWMILISGSGSWKKAPVVPLSLAVSEV